MLLPALDESEVALVSPVALVEEEVDHDIETDEGTDGLSLADLVGDEEEEEAVESTTAGDEDTLSLTDIAEQEETGEDDADSDVS
jgi:hypothetical protein